MAYTLGALHDLLAGSGSVSVSQPAGLLLTVLGYPIHIGLQPGTPQVLHRLGRITPGDANGWYPHTNIVQTQQLVLPIPAGITLVGYDLVADAGLSIRELVGDTPMPTGAAHDRNPTPWHAHGTAAPFGATNAYLWSYTVPAGRKLWVASGAIWTNRISASSGSGMVEVMLLLNGYPLTLLRDDTNVAGVHHHKNLDPSGFVVFAGHTIGGYYNSGSGGGGQYYAGAQAYGYTFDL